MSFREVVTVAFVVLLATCYIVIAAKVWRGESEIDPNSPPPFWPFSAALWRGVGRAFVILGLSVVVLIAGGVSGDVVGEDSAAYDRAMGFGSLGVFGLFFLAFPIMFFNRPKFLVPPHQRDERSALAEWRLERERNKRRRRSR